MAKRAEVKIYDNLNKDTEWELEKEISYEQMWDIRCGANPHQKAGIMRAEGMADYEIIGGTNLTYNEVLSINELSNILFEFYDVCAVAIVKDSAPCGVALAPTIEEAYDKAVDCDPIASSTGTIGFSQAISHSIAQKLNSLSVKLIIAPAIDDKALSILQKNPSIKIVILKTPLKDYKNLIQKDIKITPFGTLYQDINNSCLNKNSFQVVSKTKPSKEQIEDAVFAWKISKYTHSNSIVIAKDFKTVAIAQGFVSPVSAVESALSVACDNAKDAILVSDTTLPSIDFIYAAVQGRISTIVIPGGGAYENKIIELANKYNIAIIFTGIENFKY